MHDLHIQSYHLVAKPYECPLPLTESAHTRPPHSLSNPSYSRHSGGPFQYAITTPSYRAHFQVFGIPALELPISPKLEMPIARFAAAGLIDASDEQIHTSHPACSLSLIPEVTPKHPNFRALIECTTQDGERCCKAVRLQYRPVNKRSKPHQSHRSLSLTLHGPTRGDYSTRVFRAEFLPLSSPPLVSVSLSANTMCCSTARAQA